MAESQIRNKSPGPETRKKVLNLHVYDFIKTTYISLYSYYASHLFIVFLVLGVPYSVVSLFCGCLVQRCPYTGACLLGFVILRVACFAISLFDGFIIQWLPCSVVCLFGCVIVMRFHSSVVSLFFRFPYYMACLCCLFGGVIVLVLWFPCSVVSLCCLLFLLLRMFLCLLLGCVVFLVILLGTGLFSLWMPCPVSFSGSCGLFLAGVFFVSFSVVVFLFRVLFRVLFLVLVPPLFIAHWLVSCPGRTPLSFHFLFPYIVPSSCFVPATLSVSMSCSMFIPPFVLLVRSFILCTIL
jgi:hypothetical protein